MPNLHSHAFQRAMAGLAERLEPGEASFWSWRTVMYRFLERIGPDELRAIASQLYVEMLEAGYTAVGEFHYLHHQVDGSAFADPAELSWAILEAQRASGIGLTHLPALYMAGGFGGARPSRAAPLRARPRSLCGSDRAAEASFAEDPNLRLGIAPHSLRAVPDEALCDVVALADAIDAEAPIHIHVAEQVKEVRDCLEWCGARPVRHLFDAAPVGPRWCLVHATHMDDAETELLARSGAVAGLCPTTEANLGDGLFDLGGYLTARRRVRHRLRQPRLDQPDRGAALAGIRSAPRHLAPPDRRERGAAALRRPAVARARSPAAPGRSGAGSAVWRRATGRI